MLPDFIVAVLAGMANKLYDDFEDNPLLATFKDPMHMEVLKGLHYILFTVLSVHVPAFFFLMYAINMGNLFANPNAWVSPYEASLPYSMILLYLLADYNQLQPLTLYDVLMCIGFVFANILEPFVLKREYSSIKLMVRIYWFFGMICMSLLPLFSSAVKSISAYYVGYFFVSVLVQYYSVFIAKTNLKPPIKGTHGKKKAKKCGSNPP
jgi:hypothetical protein